MFKKWTVIIVSAYFLSGCGGGSGSSESSVEVISVSDMKPKSSIIKPGEQVLFTWSIVNEAGLSLSCSLDTNDDGIFETALNNCNDVANITFINTGEKAVVLHVETPNGTVVATSVMVTVSDIEFTVDSTADSADTLSGDGVCMSFNNTCTLRAAVMEANALSAQGLPVFINLPANTYPLTIDSTNENTALDGDLDITGKVVIRGAGSSTTIVDASLANDRVFNVLDNALLEITGVSIQGGYAIQGAGFLISKADVKFNDVIIKNNVATFGGGGGIYAIGTLEATNLVVENNTADDFGGGIYMSGLNNSLDMSNSKIKNNQVNYLGGGIYATNGDIKLNNCEISNNTAGVQGGGIYGTGANFTVIDSTISTNTSKGPGGGIFNTAAPFKLISSTVEGNVTSENSGGGIYNLASGIGYAFQIINSTLSGNITAFNGAGIWNRGSMSIAFTTITNNQSNKSGGGIFLDNFPSALADLKGVVLSGNTALENGPDCIGDITSAGYNLFGSTLGCSVTANQGDLTGLDPFLITLSDNGGLTKTHLFTLESPVINAIPYSDCKDLTGNLLIADQRGSKRQSINACDIGSVEF
ncbi:MAG: choice-of-anchor Q domain-containing protein [Pseudomonadota bacterium]